MVHRNVRTSPNGPSISCVSRPPQRSSPQSSDLPRRSIPDAIPLLEPGFEHHLGLVPKTLLHRDRAAPGQQAEFPLEGTVIEPGRGGIIAGCGEVDVIQPCPVDGGEAQRARLATGVDLATARENVPSREQASRMATTSAWAVGSFVEVTRFQPRPTICPSRTMTAPNGPPSLASIFSMERRIASRKKVGFMRLFIDLGLP
jgi:hypothetical protein